MTAQSFYKHVTETLGAGASPGLTRRATAAVFHALRDRLTPAEADQVVAQLPTELKAVWQEGEQAERQPLKMSREEFYERVRAETGVESRRDARWLTLAVFGTLQKQLSPGEAADVLAQLPQDLKETWAEALPRD
jgi:uncharacterized protein (DUF2267 family)